MPCLTSPWYCDLTPHLTPPPLLGPPGDPPPPPTHTHTRSPPPCLWCQTDIRGWHSADKQWTMLGFKTPGLAVCYLYVQTDVQTDTVNTNIFTCGITYEIDTFISVNTRLSYYKNGAWWIYYSYLLAAVSLCRLMRQQNQQFIIWYSA